MNADFEMELASPTSYRRPALFDKINRRLARHLLWLSSPGDGLLVDEDWPGALAREAERFGVELVSMGSPGRDRQPPRIFTPWGWSRSAVSIGERSGLASPPVTLETVARVNSKLWSHALEVERGIALPGSRVAATLEELQEALAHICPAAGDKWVIKSPFGFAARDRVLGRGPLLDGPAATWTKRRLASRQKLLFQPWLDVVREYGVAMEILPAGEISILGISDLQTNGAGTGTGYLLGRRVAPGRVAELEAMAEFVGTRLFLEGYTGPAGIDALEHKGGLHPLLEVNARYTMGFIALAVERSLKPPSPFFWSTKASASHPVHDS
jgi:hypothetical protein